MRTLSLIFCTAPLLFAGLYGSAYALECPSPPTQVAKDWQVEVDAVVAKIGPLSGGEVKTQARNATQDLLGKLPDAGKIYLEQMMYSGYCSALRDDKSIPESRKAQLLREYSTEVRTVLSGQPSAKPPQSSKETTKQSPSTATSIDPKAARFGVTLGWQLGRYEIVKDSPFPEAQATSVQIEEDLKALLLQDGYPQSIENRPANQITHGILIYYGAKNLEKHASILLGIAAFRASLVGASASSENNEEMKRLAYSAILEIDDTVISRKKELFSELLSRRPKNVPETLSMLGTVKLR